MKFKLYFLFVILSSVASSPIRIPLDTINSIYEPRIQPERLDTKGPELVHEDSCSAFYSNRLTTGDIVALLPALPAILSAIVSYFKMRNVFKSVIQQFSKPEKSPQQNESVPTELLL
jgi:hypothetical protein